VTLLVNTPCVWWGLCS